MNNKDGYTLTKQWFDFVDENPEKIKPTHGILWLYLVELNNRLKWKEKFGVPTDYTMRMIGVKNYKTYKNTLNDLIEWGFIQMVSKSSNQHTALILALVKFTEAHTKASPKQVQSTVDIDKQLKTEETIKKDKNPKGEAINFFISDFQEEYKNINGISYVLKTEDYSAAQKIAEIYKKETEIEDDEELRISLKEYFKTVIDHPDNFHKTRMTLSYLSNNINVINNTLKNGKHGATWQELKNIFKHPNRVWGDSSFEVTPVKQDMRSTMTDSEKQIIFGTEPPTLKEVETYFKENQYKKDVALKAYNDFCRWNWKSNAGRCFIPDWKMRAAQLYFKPENLSCDPQDLDF